MSSLKDKLITLEEYYECKNTKFCVLSLRNGKEHKSPWFYRMENAKKALSIIRAKGYKALIYVD